MMEILSSGSLNIIVDQGRIGYLGYGVSRSGPIDCLSYELGNAMLGNTLGSASVEINNFPFRVRFTEARDVALTGAIAFSRIGERKFAPWSRLRVSAGDTLVVEAPIEGRCAYLAVSGGIDGEVVLDSRSTDVKGGFGGHGGKGLAKGDTLAGGAHELTGANQPLSLFHTELQAYWHKLAQGQTTVRVLPSAEWHEFSEDTKQSFFATAFTLGRDSNRQGYRLSGAPVERTSSRELLSHGIVPGTIQIPRSGDPIIQLVDANTCGGYPKLANVIDADLWRLGQVLPGKAIRFELTDVDTAISEGIKKRSMLEKTASQWR